MLVFAYLFIGAILGGFVAARYTKPPKERYGDNFHRYMAAIVTTAAWPFIIPAVLVFNFFESKK